MKTRLATFAVTAIALLFMVGLVMPATSDAQGNLRRLTADYQPGEIATDSTPLKVYSKVFTTASQNDTLYVTMIGTADLHEGTNMSLSCKLLTQVNSTLTTTANCQPDFGDWTRVQKIPRGGNFSPNCDDGGGGTADCHDNSFVATWCFGPLSAAQNNTRTVEIYLASGDFDAFVFYEKATIYIDASRTTGACTAPALIP